jgi:hypothetical protein
MLPANHCFHGGERLIVFQSGQFRKVEEMHVSLQRQPSVLKALASRTLFPRENRVSFLKEYFLQIMVFMVEIGCLCSK